MLQEFLALQGFAVDVIDNGEAGLEHVNENTPDLVVLDVMLPGISGFDVLKQLRKDSDVPVIMLTARGEESDRIHGLMEGADDYLGKPFSPMELTARIQAVLKRSATVTKTTEVSAGPVTLNLARREASANGTLLNLTASELRVLEQLLTHPDEVLSRAQLTELALDRSLEAYDRSIDSLVSKLRKKLNSAGVNKEAIRGLRGHGYLLDTEALENK